MTTGQLQVGVDEFGLPVFETKRFEMRDGVDFAGGMGPPRELSPDKIENGETTQRNQISPEDAAILKGDAIVQQAEAALRAGSITRSEYDVTMQRAHLERAMLSAEDALNVPASAFAGQSILVIGGGPTSQWAGDHVMSGGASNVGIAGRMPRPDLGTPLAIELSAKEVEIQTRLADPSHTSAELERLKHDHHRIVARHIAEQNRSVASLNKQLDSDALPPGEAAAARAKIEAVKNDLDPFRGSRLDRNDASLNRADIDRVQMDIARVERVDGADGDRNLVTYVDGTQKTYDRVIPGIGADADRPGGLTDMLSKLPAEIRLLPIIENGRPVGLASDPPGIWITGAAAVGTLGAPPRDVMLRIPPEMRGEYRDASREWANRSEVSHGSRNVTPGIENVGDNAAWLQTAKERTPEERAELRAEWLRNRTQANEPL